MNNVDRLPGHEPLRRCDSRVPPKQIVKSEASRLRGGGILPRIPPAQRPHPDKVQVGPGMVVHILFHQGTGKTVRDDPHAVSFSEVPSPIPCNGSFGAHFGKAGMTNYEDVHAIHCILSETWAASSIWRARASSTLSRKMLPITTH